MTDDAHAQRREALGVLRELVQTHVDLSKSAVALLNMLDSDQHDHAKVIADLGVLTAKMEAIDAQIREGERVLGVQFRPGNRSGRPN